MTEADPSPDAEHGEPLRTDADRRRAVRSRYAAIAREGGGCSESNSAGSDCCGGSAGDAAADGSRAVGYTDEEVAGVAGDANLGLGCGNPTAIAGLETGETVLDLGSGGGFDCFLAGDAVGEEGRVVGVDMTPEMVEKARANVERNDASNVEFRLGEIEHLPVADESVDVVISNCVVNLSPDKPQVLREAFRVLRPGGRVAISDVVRTAPFPPELATDPEALAACVSGAATIDDLETMLADAGFEDVDIAPKDESDEFVREWADEYDPSDYLVSATVEARKPAGAGG